MDLDISTVPNGIYRRVPVTFSAESGVTSLASADAWAENIETGEQIEADSVTITGTNPNVVVTAIWTAGSCATGTWITETHGTPPAGIRLRLERVQVEVSGDIKP